jgi:hypothetical protein
MLSNDAATDYLRACELSLKFKLIGFKEFMQRLLYLDGIIDPNSFQARRLKKRINGYQSKYPLNITELEEIEREIPNELQHDSIEKDSIEQVEEDDESLSKERNLTDKNQSKDRFDYISKTKGIYSNWEFHKGDRDPNPSIPHGHSIGVRKYHKYKLDPYRGRIYDKNGNYNTKENPQFIKDLWNDDKFRKTALEAIEHFIHNNPKYKIRVANPRKLPKKSK